MLKIITKKKWNEEIGRLERTIREIEKQRDDALKKLYNFERGEKRESVCDGYCSACQKGVLIKSAYPFPYEYYACEETIPCKKFTRKDNYARLEN